MDFSTLLLGMKRTEFKKWTASRVLSKTNSGEVMKAVESSQLEHVPSGLVIIKKKTLFFYLFHLALLLLNNLVQQSLEAVLQEEEK